MGLTAGHDAFAGLNESGVNKFIGRVYTIRPHYFHYATPALGGGSVGISSLSPLPAPGIPGGLEWEVTLGQPVVDFTPEDVTNSLPSPLALGANQFSVTVDARICVVCGMRPRRGRGNERPLDRPPRRPELVCAMVRIWAVGHPTATPAGVDTVVGLRIDEIVVKNVGALEPIIECVANEVVNALLDNLKQTVTTLVLHGFGLTLAAGPTIADDQLEVWGTLIPPSVAMAGGMDVDP